MATLHHSSPPIKFHSGARIQAPIPSPLHSPHLNARACLSLMEAGEGSIVKRASEVTKVLRSMATSLLP